MIWDAQIIDWSVWMMPKPKNSKKPPNKLANDFIRFVTETDKMVSFSEMLPYGPSRKSALNRVGLHAQKGFSMRNHLPTAKHHLERAIFRDAAWYANTLKLRNARFQEWLDKK